jgi:hypothetical protein
MKCPWLLIFGLLTGAVPATVQAQLSYMTNDGTITIAGYSGGGEVTIPTNINGLTVTGTANIPIVVEACDHLAGPVWIPLATLTLTNGLFYFSDLQWTNYAGRFYRVSSP